MIGLRVTGADQLAALSRRLRETGDKGLRRELSRGIQRATRPAKQQVKAAALARLPGGGGLARKVAASRVTTRTSGRGRNPGVRIVATHSYAIHAMDRRGMVRHPVFGRRDRWVTQPTPTARGWFTDTLTAAAPQVRHELEQVMAGVARRVGGRP